MATRIQHYTAQGWIINVHDIAKIPCTDKVVDTINRDDVANIVE